MLIGARTRTWIFNLSVLLALVVVGLLIRWPYLSLPYALNPDEAEILATAKNLEVAWQPSLTSAFSTFGYPQAALFWVLQGFGVPLSVQTAHFLSLAFLIITSWLVLLLFAKFTTKLFAVLLTVPPFLVLATGPISILAFSSGALPGLLIVFSIFLLFWRGVSPSPKTIVWGNLIAGIASLAKPQYFFLALMVPAISVITLWCGNKILLQGHTFVRALFPVVSAFLAPFIVFAFTLDALGTLGLFFSETVVLQFDYLRNPEISNSDSQSLLGGFFQSASFILNNWTSLIWLGAGVAGAVMFGQTCDTRQQKAGVYSLALISVSTVTTLSLRTPIFDHYMILLYVGFVSAGISSLVFLRSDSNTSLNEKYYNGAYLVLGFVTLLVASVTINSAINAYRNEPPLALNPIVEDELLVDGGICPKGGSLLVWGWAPEYYLSEDLQPSTRYVNSTWLTRTGSKDEYMAKFKDELAVGLPDCIIDASGPGFFGGFLEEETFNAVNQEIGIPVADCYEPVSAMNSLLVPINGLRLNAQCEGRGL